MDDLTEFNARVDNALSVVDLADLFEASPDAVASSDVVDLTHAACSTSVR